MQSCSNELNLKFSKPKMSSRPTYGSSVALSAPQMCLLTFSTTNSKMWL